MCERLKLSYMIFGLTRDTKMLMRFRYKNEVISEGPKFTDKVKKEEKTVIFMDCFTSISSENFA